MGFSPVKEEKLQMLLDIVNGEHGYASEYPLWNVAPPSGILLDMIAQANVVWAGYDDTFGYASEKIEQVNWVKDNPTEFMLIWNMFDYKNQFKFASALDARSLDYLYNVLKGDIDL